jgi:hypothetical protein
MIIRHYLVPYLWSSNDESARRLQMVDGLAVEILGWDNSLYDFFHKFKPHLFELDVFRVLD